MTVCIAARSQGIILVASDRMLTAGDIQFEPATPKILFVTRSIAIMSSGDSAFHAEIVIDVYNAIQKRVEDEPDRWWTIAEVADLYIDVRNKAKRRRAVAAILGPLGLTHDDFMASQKGMDQTLVKDIASDLVNFRVPTLETIIAGIDQNDIGLQRRITTIFDDDIRCDDVVGFSAIGSGSRHAESAFMLARHSWNAPFEETLVRIHGAKRAAEIAPGVGSETDLFFIGPQLGHFDSFRPEVRSKLDEEYKKRRDSAAQGEKRAVQRVRSYLESLTEQAPAPQAAPTPPAAGTAPTSAGINLTSSGDEAV